MTHIEDKVIYGGVKGTRDAIMALRSLRDMLKGEHDGSVSVKWDGAPAIFAGIDPSDGRFFVAKKGIFNKNPKVYKTPADVDADTSGDLADKLKTALSELPALGIKGAVQGDFLYGPGDVKTKKIAGDSYVTFHPNTIVYAVPAKSDLAKKILSSKVGIVFHTAYKGGSFEDMKASYDVNVDKLKNKKGLWADDARVRDLSGSVVFSAKDTKEVTRSLSIAGKIFQKIASTTLRQIEKNPDLAQIIETHNNKYVRAGQKITNTSRHVDSLIKFINDKYQKEIDKRSTPAGKSTQQKKRDDILSFFSKSNKANLKLVFDLQNAIVDGKLKIINKLDKLSNMNTFIKTKNGFKVTGSEGYVAIDKLKGGAFKLVDRLEFSYNNFSPDVIKGWDTPSRS